MPGLSKYGWPLDGSGSIIDERSYKKPKYIIEREVPGAANLSMDALQAIAQTSNNVLKEMGKPYGHLYQIGTEIR